MKKIGGILTLAFASSLAAQTTQPVTLLVPYQSYQLWIVPANPLTVVIRYSVSGTVVSTGKSFTFEGMVNRDTSQKATVVLLSLGGAAQNLIVRIEELLVDQGGASTGITVIEPIKPIEPISVR